MHFCHHGSLWHQVIEMVKNSATVMLHGNTKNSNATINSDYSVIRNLAKHFEKWENMMEVVATRIVREMMGEVALRDTSDTKKYLPTWNDKAWLIQRVCFEIGLQSEIQQSQSSEIKMGWQRSWTRERNYLLHQLSPLLEGESWKCCGEL